jgi:glyoxylase-like metal-dependent hydrolase (beta-lactamase superfamily II)
VGDISARYPGAEIVVHEKGARHLADPSRLMDSARRVYGQALDALFGELKPTAPERIRSVEERGSIDLGGGRLLSSHYSPGHAKHHVGLIDSVSGDLYVGDAAGVFLPETGDQRPATPPPDFDLALALESLRLFAALGPERLLFSHYGPVQDVTAALERSTEELNVWVAETRRARGQGLDLDHTVAMVAERTRARYTAQDPDADPKAQADAEVISSTWANVEGILRYLDRVEPIQS